MAIEECKIGFIGAGNMGGALIAGLLNAGRVQPDQITAADPDKTAREALSARGVQMVIESAEAAAGQDVVILAVKPQVSAGVLAALEGVLSPQQLVISLMAGTATGSIQAQLPRQIPLIRAMPQTLVRLCAGATALCAGEAATAEHMALARELFDQVGSTVVVPEHLMDAVTGLSGSGPAYAYTVIEALADGGVQAGLPRAIAQALTAQTLLGAARMVLEGDAHPAVLRDQVTSPGGTTIAGLHELEAGAVRASLMRAVQAAAARSRELGRG